MIERCPRFICVKNRKESFELLILSNFLRTLIKLSVFCLFMRSLLLGTDGFLFAHSGFLHAVYLDYIPCTAKESPVSLWFSHGAEIFEIHSHFLELRMLPPLVSSDSFDIRSPFRSRYFHRIPDASPRNFWRCTDVYFL